MTEAVRVSGAPVVESTLGAYLAEYAALRGEILHRSSAQQRVEQIAFATVAAAVALGAAVRATENVIAGLAFLATILFSLLTFEFNSHREKITMIFAYFVHHLYPHIRAISHAGTFRWDEFWLREPGLPRLLSRIPLPDTGAVLYVLAIASVTLGWTSMPAVSSLHGLAITATLFVGFAFLFGLLNGLVFESYRREVLSERGGVGRSASPISAAVPPGRQRRFGLGTLLSAGLIVTVGVLTAYGLFVGWPAFATSVLATFLGAVLGIPAGLLVEDLRMQRVRVARDRERFAAREVRRRDLVRAIVVELQFNRDVLAQLAVADTLPSDDWEVLPRSDTWETLRGL